VRAADERKLVARGERVDERLAPEVLVHVDPHRQRPATTIASLSIMFV
jgi:hypothetical protein